MQVSCQWWTYHPLRLAIYANLTWDWSSLVASTFTPASKQRLWISQWRSLRQGKQPKYVLYIYIMLLIMIHIYLKYILIYINIHIYIYRVFRHIYFIQIGIDSLCLSQIEHSGSKLAQCPCLQQCHYAHYIAAGACLKHSANLIQVFWTPKLCCCSVSTPCEVLLSCPAWESFQNEQRALALEYRKSHHSGTRQR